MPATEGVPQPCPLCCALLRPAEQARASYGPPRPWMAQRPRVRCALGPGPTGPACARRTLDAFADEVDADTIAMAKLVVSELVTNAVVHGGGERSATAVGIWVLSSCVHIEVEDRGAGFDPRRAQPPLDRAGGRGLDVVDHLADSWGVSGGPRTTVWCQLARRQEARSA